MSDDIDKRELSFIISCPITQFLHESSGDLAEC